jgi:hypothetical protein
MTNWVGAGAKSYDYLGRMIQRLAGLFIGLGLGPRLHNDTPSLAFWLSKFGVLLGLGCLAIAHYRSKSLNQNGLQIRAK